MPFKISVIDLKELCIRNLVSKIDDICRLQLEQKPDNGQIVDNGQYIKIPVCLMQELIKRLSERGSLQLPHIKALIYPELKQILFCYSPSFNSINKLLSLLGDQCHGLINLRLQYLPITISPDEISNLCRSLPNIECLDFSFSRSCNDNVLQVISNSSQKLKELLIQSCSVTDKGISYLCSDTCKNLITIDVRRTVVTQRGVALAINHLQYLKIIHHPDVIGAVDNCSKLQLNTARKYNLVRLESFGLHTSTIIQSAVTSCQHVTQMVIHSIHHLSEVQALASLKVLSYLSLTIERNLLYGENDEVCKELASAFQRGVGRILEKNSKTMKHIDLHNFRDSDFSTIAYFCSNIEKIKLSFSDENNSMQGQQRLELPNNYARQVTDSKFIGFSCLCSLEVISGWDNIIVIQNLDFLLKNSENLETLSLEGIFSLDDNILNNIINNNELLHLNCLKLTQCNNVTMKTIMRLIEKQNALSEILIARCDNITFREVQSLRDFIAENRLDLKFHGQSFIW